MIAERRKLYDAALDARHLYILGRITREEAKEDITPYLKVFNEASKSIAKKYDQRPKLLSFESFVR